MCVEGLPQSGTLPRLCSQHPQKVEGSGSCPLRRQGSGSRVRPGASKERAARSACALTLLCLLSMNGALAFVDTSDCTVMNIAEHYMASDVEWDPTGRYVVTSVSWWSHKVRGPMYLGCSVGSSCARPGIPSSPPGSPWGGHR